MPEPVIHTTAEWGARSVDRQFAIRPAEGIVVHNMENANRTPEDGDNELQEAFKVARQCQISHMDGRGWADTGQHFTISRGGVVMEGRHGSLAAAENGEVVHGAHAGVDHINATWFGIELEGNYVDGFSVPDEQWQSLIDLCAWLALKGDFDSSTQIQGHMHFHSTDCPGKVMEHLGSLREAVHDAKAALMSDSGDG